MAETERTAELIAHILEEARGNLSAFEARADDLRTGMRGLRQESEEALRVQAGLKVSAKALGRTFKSSFSDAIFSARSFRETLRGLALDLSRLVVESTLQPLTSGLGEAIAGAVSVTPNARGNVVAAGRIQAFARGGILDGPVMFPLRQGLGLAGEAGPEAILPLKRGAHGRLGVAAESARPITITFNVSTPDTAGFVRSESQIAALLQRTVARGLRNG